MHKAVLAAAGVLVGPIGVPLACGTASAQSTATAPAPVGPPARCKLRIVHALPGTGGPVAMDEALGRLRPHLERGSFKQWRSFKLLSAEKAELKPGASATYAMPWGKNATITYNASVRTASGRDAVKGTLEAQGPKASHKTGFTAEQGMPFLVAGEKYQDGILIYAVSCRTGPPTDKPDDK